MVAMNTHPKPRMTRQRRIILEELRKLRTHPTAEELHVAVQVRMPRVSLGTVYRNLEFLSETGAVLKLEGVGGRRRYDGNVRIAHYHARCLGCGRIEDVPSEAVLRLEYRSEAIGEFAVTGHDLQFVGWCAACRECGLRE